MASNIMQFDRENRGQVGISFLIVFIALVLVAAIAAGLFIQTAGVLEERASNTGEEATDEVSNQIKVVSAYGQDTTTTDGTANVDIVSLSVQRAAGAGDIDLGSATIDYKGPASQTFFQYSGGTSVSPGTFGVSAVKDVDNSVPVLTRNDDVMEITLDLDATTPTSQLTSGDEATVTINTANGGERTVVLEAPMSFNDGDTVEL